MRNGHIKIYVLEDAIVNHFGQKMLICDSLCFSAKNNGCLSVEFSLNSKQRHLLKIQDLSFIVKTSPHSWAIPQMSDLNLTAFFTCFKI
jgi:hypothetical protein